MSGPLPDMRRLVLFSKPGCHLCDDARQMLDRIGHPYEVAADPRYSLRVPVIEVDGRAVTEGRVSERAVRAALRRRRWGARR
ncbi:MAG: glutaredoxin family protein [Acidobacteria bacterium]|nr:glutaredoxin family protein [Acidobacteriota bacterium]